MFTHNIKASILVLPLGVGGFQGNEIEFRNRPGDSMRDKYNLNTLPPGHEEEYGNLGTFLDAFLGRNF